MNSIEEFLKPYAEFEQSVRRLMADLFSTTCGMCTACCCRADICEEALESAFLSQLLQRQGLATENMDDRYGWLDTDGCSLKYGRPTICYTYFCDQLLARLPNEDVRYTAQVLGQLMDHIGQDALGSWHLVEIRNPDDLEKVNFEDLFHRMEEAQSALAIIKEFLQSEHLSLADRATLAEIKLSDDL